MGNYLLPIWVAILSFIVLSILISFPYLAWKYHKQGSLTAWQVLVEYGMVFYLLAAFFMTLLPLPSVESVANMTGPTHQLIPFQFVADFVRETKLVITDPGTYGEALGQSVFYEPLFNLILTLPFGVFLRYYYKKSLRFTVLASFFLSLFFELTQLTGVYGIYPRAFRLFDVDDLMLNTLGGLLGYALTPLLVYFFPTREQVDQKVAQKAQKASLPRRLIAYGIDLAVVRLLIAFFIKSELLIMFIFALVTAITMILTNGQTLGERFVHIRVVSQTGDAPTPKQILIRQFSFYFLIHFIFTLFLLPIALAGENIITLSIYLALIGAYALFMLFHFVVRTIRGQRTYFYELLSKTHIVASPLQKQQNKS
ncbi:MAG: VanZ family protein [Fastidiosipilaceae bacterium]|jgi:glycopeptide antibiotics resistance protein/uncharacterized RDD family membrane protein YckC